MFENEILHEHDKLQPTSSPGVQSHDSTHASLGHGFESNTGSMSCTGQCEPEREHLVSTINCTDEADDDNVVNKEHFLVPRAVPNIFRYLRGIFSKGGSAKVPQEAFKCEICEHPTLAFRRHCKVLLDLKIIFSFGVSLIAIMIAVSDAPPIVIFVCSLIAIVPLSMTLTTATEKLCQDLGETASALLNISIGNLAEMIIFTALMKDNIKVVQASLLGSILVNLLLVLGSAIIAGSILAPGQIYNTDLTQTFVGLLNLTVCCLMIPGAFYGSVKYTNSADAMALSFNRAVSIIFLGIYFLYLFFQFRSQPHLLYSHSSGTPFPSNASNRINYDRLQDEVYSDEESHPVFPDTAATSVIFPPQTDQFPCPHTQLPAPTGIHAGQGLPMVNIDTVERSNSAPNLLNSRQNYDISGNLDDHYCGNLVLANRAISLGLLVSSTILIAVCAEFFASSFQTLNDQNILGESFVGLIIIPIVGNVPENVTAAIVAGRNQMDLAISIALGSAIQIGLFVTPVIVLAGWALDKPMSLHFDHFGMVTLVGSALLVSFIILKGKTNYLEGAILCVFFAAIS
ncbi:hypothetical protein PEBR_35722 [Penicillium brasilianum]|uniref:Sodium/calcium exchanger membrane region domain-containing protein n=1 Tax=Penicillium brasilianum TaxID=104259 RepID=A0A1S9RDX2_PENBI|nr:hypothetical protein PEBR_35722 [Penicillium brasilianum]